MNIELTVTLLIVAAAAGYLGWRMVRFALGLRRGRCGGGCGCGTKATQTAELIKPEELVLRRRP
jgi:hypothetical protein